LSAPGAPDAGQDARREAQRLLAGVLERGRMLSTLTAEMSRDLAPEDRARATSLATETLRRMGQADALISRFAAKRTPDPARNILRAAAVEMMEMGVPPHAAVDGAVRLVKANRRSARLAPLVNAVARKIAAEGAEIWASQDAARLNTPGWLWGRLSGAYGGVAARIIATAHLAPAPTDLTLRAPADAAVWAERLGAAILPTGSLRLTRPGRVTGLPGFAEGAWWVQDAAAALPARLLGDVAGKRVLDLCAAPGGKTLQLAAAGAEVVALDISEARLVRLRENLERTGLTAEVVAADMLEWAPEAPFDAVLLDAPCSASGTVRRHPDLPHHRTGSELKGLTALQDALLARAWDWVRPGGRMVFCTCSLFPEEGEQRIAAFRAAHPEARTVPVDPAGLGGPAEWGDAQGDLRLRPDYLGPEGGMDGFFAACVSRDA
jgi:16S rRNA (cytosine967-C5)-methyltransferase